MKTLADLKREAKSGTLEARMILRCGSTDIPESLQGWRKITGCNSVAIFILRNDGKKSDLPLKKASLVEYDGQTLTTYAAGLRDLTEEEQRVMDGWKKISSTEEFKERAINDAYTDGSSTYYQEKWYFENAGFGYLMGFNEERGMRRDFATGKIIDDRIKGDVVMRYEIRNGAQ